MMMTRLAATKLPTPPPPPPHLPRSLLPVSHIYISYTVPKKYKRRMHEKFPSLHRGSYKANLLKMAELDGERNFFQGLILIE